MGRSGSRTEGRLGEPVLPALEPAPSRLTAWSAVAAYALIAVAWTWPLGKGLTTDLPWDLGDSLLNAWILAWHFHQAGRVLHGDLGAFADWWHPNIFHPSPYGLGQSELLVAQALQGAPIHALTGNVLLTYNLLFISSFVLSALGAFLLVRSLTRNGLAALVAGLLYGFALYRVNQGPHLQVLSSQWFPFVLWGLHEWWQAGRMRHAVLAGLALAMQNLSNGYFLVYAALWLPPYVVAQIFLRGRVRDAQAWLGPAVTAIVGIGITAPFLYPYLQLRRLGQPPRPLAAVVQYSADSWAWLTANDQLRLWSTHLQTFVRPEGDLFPGLVPLVLAAIAMGLVGAERWRGSGSGDGRLGHLRPQGFGAQGQPALPDPYRTVVRRSVAVLAGVLTAGHVVAILLVLFAGVQRLHLGPVAISMTDGTRLLVGFALSLGVLIVASPRARNVLRDDPQQPLVIWMALAALTVWFSFGPIVHIGGRTARTWPSLYAAVYQVVPGANALRVPPRIAMVTALALAVIGGLAVAALTRRRHGALASGLLAAAFVAESWPAPVPINLRIDPSPLRPLVEPIPPRPAAHPLAMAIAALPEDAVLVDLPFGSLPYEVWWQYLSIGHWRPRVNGYSGDMPPGFLALDQMLASLPERLMKTDASATRPYRPREVVREAAVLDALTDRGTTHVLLHAGAWAAPGPPDAVRAWLREAGAVRHAIVGTTEIWRLRP